MNNGALKHLNGRVTDLTAPYIFELVEKEH